MRALVVILGLLVGAAAGAALVLMNPLAWLRGLPPLPGDLAPAKTYRAADFRGIQGGVADLLGLARPDPAVMLRDPALARLRVGILVLPAGTGTPAALAVKVSTVAADNSLWQALLGTRDYWNVFWPGEGSVFASAYSNQWALARDGFFAGLLGGDRDVIATSYPLTAAAPDGELPVVTGAAGRYAGFTGELREAQFPAARDSESRGPDWSLALKVNPPPVAAR